MLYSYSVIVDVVVVYECCLQRACDTQTEGLEAQHQTVYSGLVFSTNITGSSSWQAHSSGTNKHVSLFLYLEKHNGGLIKLLEQLGVEHNIKRNTHTRTHTGGYSQGVSGFINTYLCDVCSSAGVKHTEATH